MAERVAQADTPQADWVRSILRCPACRSPLTATVGPGGDTELWCDGSAEAGCRRQYRIDHGIPVLLVSEARVPGAPDAGGAL